MLYHLAHWAMHYWSFFNVVHYISFRAMAGLLSALLFSFLFGQKFIDVSKKLFRSKAREWTPETHKAKDNLPTMGGIFILFVVVVNSLLWSNLANPYIWIFLFCILSFGAIGGWDDWKKIKTNRGISAGLKFKLQCLVGLLTALLLWLSGIATTITVPFIKWFNPAISVLFIPWVIFLLVGTSNAVNLTDGLDGLAITSLIPNFATFSIIAYLAGHYKIATYLHIPFANSAELAVVGAVLVGASIGFLWYNTYPAQIFMGDVGSLALGAALAYLAIVSKQELLLGIAGGLFVVEALSVILQVYSFRHYGKRIFKMAPIHHHFELLGWQESKITARFGIISLILCLLALMTLKIR